MTKATLNLDEFPTLHRSRVYSLRLLESLTGGLAARAEALPSLSCIAAGGSVGRLESRPGSDLDSIIVQSAGNWSALECDAALSVLFACAVERGLKAPKAWGIYRTPIKAELLCAASSLGNLDEAPAVFGKRIQILLDARPIYGHASFRQVRRGILNWYTVAPAAFGLDDRWAYLRRDLARYACSYTNWQLFKLERSAEDSWLLRQAKLRSSRYVTWLGLWLVLDTLNQVDSPSDDLLDALFDLTPLERIGQTMGSAKPALFHTLLQNYEQAMAILGDPGAMRQLLHSGPAEHPGYVRGVSTAFDSILAATTRMRNVVESYFAQLSRSTPAAEWL